jgi:copper chaperone
MQTRASGGIIPMQVQEVVLSVPDISCEHCAHTINSALAPLAGVETVNTNIAAKTVNLRFDPDQVSLDQIAATLDEEGYPVAK